MLYVDRGCEISQRCLDCPLAECVDGPSIVDYRYEQRILRVTHLLDEGEIRAGVIAQSLGISRRTVFRIASRWREGRYKTLYAGHNQTAEAVRCPVTEAPPAVESDFLAPLRAAYEAQGEALQLEIKALNRKLAALDLIGQELERIGHTLPRTAIQTITLQEIGLPILAAAHAPTTGEITMRSARPAPLRGDHGKFASRTPPEEPAA